MLCIIKSWMLFPQQTVFRVIFTRDNLDIFGPVRSLLPAAFGLDKNQVWQLTDTYTWPQL